MGDKPIVQPKFELYVPLPSNVEKIVVARAGTENIDATTAATKPKRNLLRTFHPPNGCPN
jgi:hypothetical protein